MTVFMPNRSIDDCMGAENQEGVLRYVYNFRTTPGVTAATVTTGSNSWMRSTESLVVPAQGANVVGRYCQAKAYNNGTGQMLLAWETLLGSCARSGGSDVFTAGSPMPVRRWSGKSVAAQMVSVMPMMYVPASFTGSVGATVTTTYTNELGVGSRTCVLTMGSNPAIGSVYQMAPHLQGSDLGILSVQNIAFSGGTTSAVRVYGNVPLHMSNTSAGTMGGPAGFLQPVPQPSIQPGDSIAGYRGGTFASASGKYMIWLLPETT